jgi:hypothetical protein
MSARVRYWGASAAIFLAGAAVTSVLFINLCGAIFQCGCVSLWAGADKHCNIHAHSGKHCPWCSYGETGYYTVYGSMVGTQAILSFLPRRRSWLGRLLACLSAFPAVGLVMAFAFGMATGYWD